MVRISEKPDGGVVLELNVTGLEAIQRWIMSYGSRARVLGPPQLVDSIRREAEAVVRSYADL